MKSTAAEYPTNKLLHVVDLFERRLQTALEEAHNHIGIYEEFTEDLMKHHLDQLQEWRATIRTYESGSSGMKSPYTVEGESTTSMFRSSVRWSN